MTGPRSFDAAQIADDQPNILARLQRERGSVPNVYRVLANAPTLADVMRTVALTLRDKSSSIHASGSWRS